MMQLFLCIKHSGVLFLQNSLHIFKVSLKISEKKQFSQ